MALSPLSRKERCSFLEKVQRHSDLTQQLYRLLDWALELRPKITEHSMRNHPLPQQLVTEAENFKAVCNRFQESCSLVGIRTSPCVLEDYCTLASEISSR
jgi:hypothetical protein